MEHRKVRVCLANRADRLVKTAAVKRRSYVYRFFGKETENGMPRHFVEEIEIRVGEDGVTAENIKELYSAEDAEIYRNLKECRKTYDAEERRRVSEWTENYVSAFRAKYGYDPQPMDLKETVEERFPRTRNVPLNDILNTEDIENQRFFDDEPGFLEAADELARAWPASWREIYERVLRNGESVSKLARERGVTEGAVRKTLGKIVRTLRENEELRKFIRFF